MKARSLLILAAAAGTLAACSTTGGRLPPTEVIRYHLGQPIARGTIPGRTLSATGPASIEFKTYAAAVETALLRNGYSLAQGDAQPDFIATVNFTRANRLGPPRAVALLDRSGRRQLLGRPWRGGVGLGGGLSFPIGKSQPQEIIGTELSVQIKRRVDQSPSGKAARATSRRFRPSPSSTRRRRPPSLPMRCSPNSPANRAARSR